MLNQKKFNTELLENEKKLYTFIRSVTFGSNGKASITENGVTTSTRVLITRCIASASSLTFTAKVTADNTIELSAYNTQNAGSNWQGTADLTFLIDNR